jgi:hypothetical protein
MFQGMDRGLLKFRIGLISAVLLLTFAGSGRANEASLAIGPNVSTLGIGAEMSAGINSFLNFRLGANTFPFKFTDTAGDIEYDIDGKLLSGRAVIDVYPFEGIFHVTAGALLNGNNADLKAIAASSYTIGDLTFRADEVGNLTGKVDFDSLNPYLGLGWGNPLHQTGNWSFQFEAGVVFQGSPKLSLTADGPISSNPIFLYELEKERQKAEDDIDKYRYYPVVSLSVSYSF